MFFDKFGNTLYEISNKEKILVPDFIKAVSISPSFLKTSEFFIPYSCNDDETPESISYKFYGTTSYHWVICVINGKIDYINDYPKSEKIIFEFTQQKYGTTNKIHHYEDVEGNWVDSLSTELKIPITVFEYELIENEKKRNMKILKKELISEFVSSYQGSISNG